MTSNEADAQKQAELDDLRLRCSFWDECYYIQHDEATGRWLARYKTAGDELAAGTCDGLRQLIQADYQGRRLAEQRLLAHLRERSST